MFGGKKSSGGGLYGEFKAQTAVKKDAVEKTVEVSAKGGGGREDVCVYSLRHGTGVSHLAASIANYFANNRRGATSLVLNNTEFSDEVANAKVNVVSWESEAEAFAKSNFIIHDVGVHGDLSANRRNALARGSVKILVCKADGAYLQRLAEYVESGVTDIHNIVFLFNELPAELEKKVRSLMDFTDRVYFVPTFYSLAPSAQVTKVFHSIFKGK